MVSSFIANTYIFSLNILAEYGMAPQTAELLAIFLWLCAQLNQQTSLFHSVAVSSFPLAGRL